MRFLFCSAMAALLLAGCSKGPDHRADVQPVEGQVLWNGKPLNGAQVIFYPQGEAAPGLHAPRARTGPDGRFQVGTYDTTDGAPEGEYVVTVVHFPLVQRGSDVVPGPNILPKKYANPKTTDLRIHVAKGANALPALTLQ